MKLLYLTFSLTIILLLMPGLVSSQKSSDSLIYEKTNSLGEVFLISNNSIKKKSGLEVYNFSEKSSSKITSVDVSNPFKIIVYFADQNKMIILDNKLSQQGNSIFFDNYEIYEVQLLCSSYIGGFWIMEGQNSELIKFDSNNKIIIKKNINTFLKYHPIQMTENNNKLYITSSHKDIFEFDEFGNFIKEIKPSISN